MPTEPKRSSFRGLRASLIWAYRDTVAPAFLRGPTISDEVQVCWFVESGWAEVRRAGEVRRVEPGEWLFHATRPGTQRIGKGTRLLSLRFRLEIVEGEPMYVLPRDLVFVGEKHPELKEAALALVGGAGSGGTSAWWGLDRTAQELVRNFEHTAAFHRWLSVYVRVLARAGSRANMPPLIDARVERALAFIEGHPMKRPFREAQLARAAGLSVPQLIRLVRAETGCAPVKLYDQRRLEAAKAGLGNPARAVKQIAAELGFLGAPHFSTWFRARTGQSPREFRKEVTAAAAR